VRYNEKQRYNAPVTNYASYTGIKAQFMTVKGINSPQIM
jgi:hypothetical protein